MNDETRKNLIDKEALLQLEAIRKFKEEQK